MQPKYKKEESGNDRKQESVDNTGTDRPGAEQAGGVSPGGL
jgi:hypothetical protein